MSLADEINRAIAALPADKAQQRRFAAAADGWIIFWSEWDDAWRMGTYVQEGAFVSLNRAEVLVYEPRAGVLEGLLRDLQPPPYITAFGARRGESLSKRRERTGVAKTGSENEWTVAVIFSIHDVGTREEAWRVAETLMRPIGRDFRVVALTRGTSDVELVRWRGEE